MDPRIETVLEDCRQRMAGGQSVEQCIAAHSTYAVELRSLLPLLTPLRQLTETPDAAFVAAARQRFHSRLREAQPARDRRAAPLRWLQRLAIPVATVLALGGSGFGLVTASADALPGSPLFHIQQAREQVIQRLAHSPEQQVTYQLGLVAHRLRLVHRAKVEHASPVVIDELTASMVQATSRAAQELQAVPKPQRQRILAQAAPLLTQEERILAQDGGQRTNPSPALVAQRRAQFLAAQQRLRAEQTTPATPRAVPSRQPSATPRPTVPTHPLIRRRRIGAKPAAHSSRPTATPRRTATPRPAVRGIPGFVATRTARLRRYLNRYGEATPQPVHTATP